MSTRTATGKGLDRPHKSVAAVPGIGSKFRNAKSINTEKTPNKKIGSGGLPSTYFGNSKACGCDSGRK